MTSALTSAMFERAVAERTRRLEALREAGLGQYLEAIAPLMRTPVAITPREARDARPRTARPLCQCS
jgi:hypothetical protein